MKTNILAFTLVFSFFLSCQKKAEELPSTAKVADFKLELEHVVGNEAIGLFKDYTNSSAETFQITTFKYYVSNIKLSKPDGSIHAIPNTYFLVDALKPGTDIGKYYLTIPKVPVGNYSGISFLLGVDSAQTESGAKEGDLAAEKGMYWAWEGYKSLQFDGNSPASKNSGKSFSYQIFGYKGTYNALRTISLDFGKDLMMVKSNAMPIVHISVDVLEFFKNPADISIANLSKTQIEADSTNRAISKNYVDMFRLEHIHN